MSAKKNLILLLVLVVVSGAYYLFDVKWASEKKAAEVKKTKVLKGADPKRIQRIALDREKEPYQIILTEKGWRFVKPVDAAVDAGAIKTLLKAAEGLSEKRRIENAKDRAEFGLDKPKRTLTFGLKDQRDIVIHLGDETPTRQSVYASLGNDGPVFLVDESEISKFDKKVFRLRDRAILPITSKEAQKIVVEPKGEEPFTVVRSKKDKDKWNMISPVKDKADSTDSEGVVSTLHWDQVNRFVDEDPKDLKPYGLDDPRYVVKVFISRDQKKPEDGILVGKEKIEKPDASSQEEKPGGEKSKPRVFYYARRLSGGPVFLVTQKTVQDLPANYFKLRDKTVVDYDVDDVTRMKLEGPAETVDILRKAKRKWELHVKEAGGGKKTLVGRHKHLDDLMWDIKWAKSIAYVDQPGDDLAKYGLGPKDKTWHVSVWLRGKKKGAPETKKSFVLGTPIDGKAYGRLDGQKRLFAFSKKDFHKIARSAFFLSERRLVAFDEPEDIEKLAVTLPDGKKAVIRRPSGGLFGGGSKSGWEFEKPKGLKVNEDKVTEFVSTFRDMESEGRVEGVAPGTKARFTVSLTDTKGKTHGPFTFYEGGPKKFLWVREGTGGPVVKIPRQYNEDQLPKSLDDWVKKKNPGQT